MTGTAVLDDGAPWEWVPVTALTLDFSPRLEGENPQHTRVLAEAETPLPPILVHRPSMRVIDGTHRLRAALLKGEEAIAVRFVDGSESEAFVLAVRANIAHGLPLTTADRRAAAARILVSHAQWSDRAIAAATGLAAKTVSGLRTTVPSADGKAGHRVGLDGKARPLDKAAGRRAAGQIFMRDPQVSLRQAARAANISPGTARDVRERVRRGEDPAARNPRHAGAEPPRFLSLLPPPGDTKALMDGLRNDPSLRFTDRGRQLLRWLLPRLNAVAGWQEISEEIPPHSAHHAAVLARMCAAEWLQFAERLDERFARPDEESA